MTDEEKLRVFLFLAIVATVFVLAARVLVRRLLRWARAPGRPPGKAQLWMERAVLAAAAAGILCVLYGAFVEPYWPQVTHVRITSRRLPAGTRPIRVVHLSDLHCDAKARLEGRLPGLVAAERPDLIVFTGDAINSPDGLPAFRSCMTALAKIAPTFAVRGNWDTNFWSGLDLYGGTGVRELDDDGEALAIRGADVFVAGVPADDVGRATALDERPRGAFTIFLYHYPDLIEDASRRQIDLYCAGHTHGGQIALPFYGALVTLSKYGKRFESGLHRVGKTWLYVNRGIGMEGGRAPRVRFCARPEITVIEGVPAG